MERIIETAIGGVFTAISLVLGVLQLNERGVPLNNAYLYASKEKKQTINKAPYYRQSGIVFMLLTLVFALLTAAAVFWVSLLSYLALGVCAATLIYAIVSSVMIEKNSK